MASHNLSVKSSEFPLLSRSKLNKMCRLCLQTPDNLQDLVEVSSLQILRQMSKLELKLDKGSPTKVCEICLNHMDQVEEVNRFITKCKRSEHVLNVFLKMSKNKQESSIDHSPNTNVEHAPNKRAPEIKVTSEVQIIPLSKKDGGIQGPVIHKKFRKRLQDGADDVVLIPVSSQKETSDNNKKGIKEEKSNEDQIQTTSTSKQRAITMSAFSDHQYTLLGLNQENEESLLKNEDLDRSNNMSEPVKSSTSNDLVQVKDKNGKSLAFQFEKKLTTINLSSITIKDRVPKAEKQKRKSVTMQKKMCENCGTLTAKLTEHKNKNNGCSYQCDKCDNFVTIEKKYLQTHMVVTHNEPKPKRERKRYRPNPPNRKRVTKEDGTNTYYYLCVFCNEFVEDLLKHRQMNESCWYKCELCDYKTYRNHLFTSHKWVVHMGNRYKCPHCESTFAHPDSYHRHMRTAHFGYVRPDLARQKVLNAKKCRTCEFCGSKFFSLSAYQRHMDIHSKEKPYQCEYCEEAFGLLKEKKTHIDECHADMKPNEAKCLCEVCGKEYDNVASLKVHVRRRHPKALLMCDQCPYKAAQEHILRRHKMTHTNEKPFKCLTCEKQFRWKKQLHLHMLAHMNMKNFPCQYCDKRFVLRRTRDLHEQRHSHERPYYPCHCCEKGFYSTWSRKKHVITRHGVAEVANITKDVWKIQFTENDIDDDIDLTVQE